jgi:flagellum-specific peptidoglycan hydrolase FlgJ
VSSSLPVNVARISVAAFAIASVGSVVWLAMPGGDSPPRFDPSTAIPLPDIVLAEELHAPPEEKLGSTDLEAQRDGSKELVEDLAARWPKDHRGGFLSAVAPTAVQSAVDNCLPPSVTLAQAALESGWGRSGLATEHANLFGIKSGSGSGVALRTREVVNGTSHKRVAKFRVFDDWGASVRYHDALISKDPRYSSARENSHDWRAYLDDLAPVYATDPDYVEDVSALVTRYDLDEWDALVTRIAQKRGACAKAAPAQ